MSTRTRSEPRPLACLALLAALALAPTARADDDSMAPYRGRFQSGMERYKAGDVAAAVASWEPIYTEVGPDKGYRVAFDLARAYDKLGDAAKATDRYRAFLKGVDDRRARGEALEPVVVKEESEARARLAEAGGSPESAAVPPKPAEPAPAPPVTAALPPTPAPSPPPSAPPLPSPTPPAPTAPPPSSTVHPFSPWVLAAGGALTAGAGIVCAVEYGRALSTRNDFNAASGVPTQTSLRDTYDGIRPVAYGALGATLGLAAVTGALTGWYFAGAREGTPQVTAGPTTHGAQIGLSARF